MLSPSTSQAVPITEDPLYICYARVMAQSIHVPDDDGGDEGGGGGDGETDANAAAVTEQPMKHQKI